MINRGIIRKLFIKGLSSEERAKLNESKLINNLLLKQWEEFSCSTADYQQEQRIWNKINNKKRSTKRFITSIKQFSVAASIILFIGCCTLATLLLNQPKHINQTWYITSTGKQNMDSIMFSDGSYALVNAGSKITYPKEFIGGQRIIHLSGQAFFSIAKDERRPFIIKTKCLNVTALGTSFEVFSYDSDECVETILHSGKIKVETKNLDNELPNNIYILNPNNKLSYSTRTQNAKIETIDVDRYKAWRTSKKLTFKNEKLAMIILRLEKWHGQAIFCPVEIVNHYHFTFSINQESLDLILSIICKQTGLSFSVTEQDKLYIIK